MIWIALFYVLMCLAHVVIGWKVLRRGPAVLFCGAVWPVMSLVALKAAYDLVSAEG